MTPAPRPDEAYIARVRKILKDYPDRIAAVEVPSSTPAPEAAPGTGEKDSLDLLSEKLASFDQRINPEIGKESGVFQKIGKKIESELAGVPARRFIRPDTPAAAAETGQDPGKSPGPPPYNPPSAPVKKNSRAEGGVAIHLLSAGIPAPAAEKTAVSRSKPWAASAVLILSAAAGGIWLYINSVEPVHKVFPLSYARTAGLAVKGQSVFSADPQRRLLFTLARESGQVKAVQKFPNRRLSGLAAGDDCFWSTDLERIYQHNMDSDYSVRRSFANPSQTPGAIYWHGGFLWVGDSRTATISRYTAGESPALVKQYALPGVTPAGFYVSENLLWILDPAANKITRYLLGPTLDPADRLDLGFWTPAGSRTTGFTVDASDLFLVTENPAELHRIDLKNLKRPAFQKESP